MELRFEAMLYSNLGKENSDAGHIKCSRGRAGSPLLLCMLVTSARTVYREFYLEKRVYTGLT